MTAFKKWYDANKEEYNKRRAEKRKANPPPPKPAKEVTEVSLLYAASIIGVSWTTLRGWVERGVIPTPEKVAGVMWIHVNNVPLLKTFYTEFMSKYPRRVPISARDELERWSNWLTANWTTTEN